MDFLQLQLASLVYFLLISKTEVISIHTFGAGLIVCKIGKGGLLRFSVFLLLDDLDFMVRAKEALNGIPLLEILFHAYIVSVLKGCYCCFFLFVTIMIILIVNSRSLSHSQPSHFNWRFLLRRSFRALAAALNRRSLLDFGN